MCRSQENLYSPTIIIRVALLNILLAWVTSVSSRRVPVPLSIIDSPLLSRNPERIPLPLSSSSVKCSCQSVPASSDTHRSLESVPKQIKIQIFKSEEDKEKYDDGNGSEIQNRSDEEGLGQEEEGEEHEMQSDHFSSSDGQTSEEQSKEDFKAFRNIQLFRNPIKIQDSVIPLDLGSIIGPFMGPRR
jgi:hypothetical protein